MAMNVLGAILMLMSDSETLLLTVKNEFIELARSMFRRVSEGLSHALLAATRSSSQRGKGEIRKEERRESEEKA